MNKFDFTPLCDPDDLPACGLISWVPQQATVRLSAREQGKCSSWPAKVSQPGWQCHAGVLEGATAAFGLHVMPHIPTGECLLTTASHQELIILYTPPPLARPAPAQAGLAPPKPFAGAVDGQCS